MICAIRYEMSASRSGRRRDMAIWNPSPKKDETAHKKPMAEDPMPAYCRPTARQAKKR